MIAIQAQGLQPRQGERVGHAADAAPDDTDS
jgi:hypothetical protein